MDMHTGKVKLDPLVSSHRPVQLLVSYRANWERQQQSKLQDSKIIIYDTVFSGYKWH